MIYIQSPLVISFALMFLTLAPSEGGIPPCSEYEILLEKTNTCVARCPLSCGSGLCYEDNTCACEDRYTPISQGYICSAPCVEGCQEAGGICAAPDLCICREGKIFNRVLGLCIWNPRLLDPCRGRCRYGSCSLRGTCTCPDGYFYNSNAAPGEQLCTPRCFKDCGPNAHCVLPDMCACIGKTAHYGPNGVCR